MPIRFAILGAGRIGQVHARAVAGNDDAVLAAVFDPVAEAASAISALYGAEVRSVEEIASADDIDAVILCTPTDLHAEQIELFSRAGKAVFCEKPIDLDSVRVRPAWMSSKKPEQPSWSGSTAASIRISWASRRPLMMGGSAP